MLDNKTRTLGFPMLLMLGGAPRAGKGIISKRCVEEGHFFVVSLDVLKMGLHHAVPSVRVDASADPSEVGRRMWPLVRAMAQNVVEADLDYLFEGDMLLPAQIRELHELFGGKVRSCFVGYRKIEPFTKLAEIRNNTGYPNDWVAEHTDEEILEVVEYGKRFSQRLSKECEDLGLTYFDGSSDFEGAVKGATTHFLGSG